MAVVTCDVPAASLLDPAVVRAADFKDSYRAPLRHAEASMATLFFALFGHHPTWVKAALLLRNRVAALFGLDMPSSADIVSPEMKGSYAVGDLIGPWPIYTLTETELIAGRDNRHLDFRLSVLRTSGGSGSHVVVSTICSVHNLAGKIYLLFVVPFHKWGVRRLMSNAVTAGRL